MLHYVEDEPACVADSEGYKDSSYKSLDYAIVSKTKVCSVSAQEPYSVQLNVKYDSGNEQQDRAAGGFSCARRES